MYQIQSAFHRFGSVADPVNGGARDGDYIGTGDPANPSTCPATAANAGNRGTLCTFFKYVAAAFQPANKLISLAPSYKTHFDVLGSKATI